VGGEIERIYFPHTGMVSLVAVMQSGATVETATIGRAGIIGASAGLGARSAFGRAIVQCQAIRDLIVRYNDLLLAQIQQSVACNASCAGGQALP
jgi:hypothetical protein